MDPATPAAAAPMLPERRIDALDAARGLALLGIFTVNIIAFSNPLGRLFETAPHGAAGPDLAAWWFVNVFTEGKFYPLFSMMFGMGLVLQMRSVESSGRSFVPLYLRRLFVLACIGLVHAIFLWYGDILFIYSLAGVGLLLVARFRASTLAIIGAVLLGLAVLMGGALTALNPRRSPQSSSATASPAVPAAAPETPPAAGIAPPAPPPVPAAEAETGTPTPTTPPVEPPSKSIVEQVGRDTPFFRFLDLFRTKGESMQPQSADWMAAETECYRDGPYLDATLMRGLTFLIFLLFAAFGYFPHILAMFLFGAALLKAGLFEPRRAHWHRRFVAIGIAVGLPFSLFAVAAPIAFPGRPAAVGLGAALLMIGGPLMSLGYLGAITLAARSNLGIGRGLARFLTPVGRMALTNYLLQTVTATAVMYHWGLGHFGEVPLSPGLLLVACVYAAQVAFSHAWLRAFRFGPMEWLWRALTYLQLPPLRR